MEASGPLPGIQENGRSFGRWIYDNLPWPAVNEVRLFLLRRAIDGIMEAGFFDGDDDILAECCRAFLAAYEKSRRL